MKYLRTLKKYCNSRSFTGAKVPTPNPRAQSIPNLLAPFQHPSISPVEGKSQYFLRHLHARARAERQAQRRRRLLRGSLTIV